MWLYVYNQGENVNYISNCGSGGFVIPGGSAARKEDPVMTVPVYVGCDDSGYEAKLSLLSFLDSRSIPFVDCGSGPEPSRYPYYAAQVASAVSEGRARFGILLCGTGIGMSIAANKYPGVRAACVSDCYAARLTRRHNDSNILCLGAQLLGSWQITRITDVWLRTEYDAGHHEGSLELLRDLEAVNLSGEKWLPDSVPYPAFRWDPAQEL